VAGRILVIPSSTVVSADDRGLLHGDGVFETIHLRPGGPWLLDAHLDRMAASARMLDLPLPPHEALVALAEQATSAWQAEVHRPPPTESRPPGDSTPPDAATDIPTPDAATGTPTPDAASDIPTPDAATETPTPEGPAETPTPEGSAETASAPFEATTSAPVSNTASAAPGVVSMGAREGGLRLICTRGPVDGPPTVYATVSPVPDATLRERRDGIRLITADLGVSARRPPWSISGAKSTSYAQNMAARRWAVAQGADEVLWFSIEGYALETPTASLVWLAGDTLCTVPAAETGVLAGTTATYLLSRAAGLGLRSAEAMITRESLAGLDGIWLTSSLRGLAEAVTLDGRQRRRSAWTGRFLELLGF
jgi:4-amino-4-deoxychorismate lyase